MLIGSYRSFPCVAPSMRVTPGRMICLSDAQIQLISGHKTKKSLEVYQHLSLQAVESAYQEAVHSLNI